RSVTMSKLVEDTFFATVEIQRGRTTANIDARPSDAINIGLRAGAPIFAEEEVLAKASQRFRVTKTERAGSAALVESFEERQRIAKRVLKEEAAEAPQNWRDLGLERLDDGPDR
ncbi:MAG: bifunctional nuclease domain-containing protein, partial [Dehalococcoidia bacterium]|nr:bifunctional nuclease domain-containing protein [Dehalococcoidia bacterium]